MSGISCRLSIYSNTTFDVICQRNITIEKNDSKYLSCMSKKLKTPILTYPMCLEIYLSILCVCNNSVKPNVFLKFVCLYPLRHNQYFLSFLSTITKQRIKRLDQECRLTLYLRSHWALWTCVYYHFSVHVPTRFCEPSNFFFLKLSLIEKPVMGETE